MVLYRQRSFGAVDKLKRAIIEAWQKQPQSLIDKSVVSEWRRRMKSIVRYPSLYNNLIKKCPLSVVGMSYLLELGTAAQSSQSEQDLTRSTVFHKMNIGLIHGDYQERTGPPGCLALASWAGWPAGQMGRHVKC